MEDSTPDQSTQPGSAELIRYTWFKSRIPAAGGFVLAADDVFPMERAVEFAEHFGINAPGTLILPCPPIATNEEYAAHPLTMSSNRRFNQLVGYGARDFRYLVTLNYPRPDLDDTSKQFKGWFYWEGTWVEIQYAPMRNSCSLIEEAFHTDAVVCEHCSMRGKRCRSQIQWPVLKRIYGDSGAAEFWLENESFRFPDNPKELYLEYSEPPGFQKVSHFEVRLDERDIIPQEKRYGRSEACPVNMRFHQEAMKNNRGAKNRATAKGVETRRKHLLVCGNNETACHFKSAGKQGALACTRWKRGRCSRRWSSVDELLADMMLRFRNQHSTSLDQDIEFAFFYAGRKLGIYSPSTLRKCNAVYRGLVRTRGEYLHQIYAHPGVNAARVFEGSLDDMLRWLRRYAPLEQVIFQRLRGPNPYLKEEQVAMVLCLAEYSSIKQRVVYASSFSGAAIVYAELGTTHASYSVDGFEWFARNYSWPPYAEK